MKYKNLRTGLIETPRSVEVEQYMRNSQLYVVYEVNEVVVTGKKVTTPRGKTNSKSIKRVSRTNSKN